MKLTSPARRFAGTTFGIKTRLAALSVAVARVQLRHSPERIAQQRETLMYLSQKLQRPGIHTFMGPADIERTYFQYLLRYDATYFDLPIAGVVAALRAEGCEVELPRYPLLHQQPLFTKGHFARLAGLEKHSGSPAKSLDAPNIEGIARELIQLPTFPRVPRELLDQYAIAIDKVLSHSHEIAVAMTDTR